MIARSERYAATSPAAGGLSASCGVAVMDDIIEQFRAALADAGVCLHPSESIRADGVLHRARSADDKPGKLSCWYRLHLDAPPSGAGGDWRTGARLTWCSKRLSSLSPTEREALRQRIERERAQHLAEQEARHREAAKRGKWAWEHAKPVSAQHPYLLKKQIAPGIARQRGDALVLPVLDFSGYLRGVQYIRADGTKRFIGGMAKAGGYIPVAAKPDGTRPLWIAEGWATASTLQNLRPSVCVVAGLDAGNLASVAIEARKRWPSVALVIAPDFDAVGQAKGHDAAIAARAKILPMPAEIPEGASDWNDWANSRRGVRHGA